MGLVALAWAGSAAAAQTPMADIARAIEGRAAMREARTSRVIADFQSLCRTTAPAQLPAAAAGLAYAPVSPAALPRGLPQWSYVAVWSRDPDAPIYLSLRQAPHTRVCALHFRDTQHEPILAGLIDGARDARPLGAPSRVTVWDLNSAETPASLALLKLEWRLSTGAGRWDAVTFVADPNAERLADPRWQILEYTSHQN